MQIKNNLEKISQSIGDILNENRQQAWKDKMADKNDNYLKKLVFCMKKAQKTENFQILYDFLVKNEDCIDLVNDCAFFLKDGPGIQFAKYFYSHYDKLSPEDSYQLKYYIRWLERKENEQNDVFIER